MKETANPIFDETLLRTTMLKVTIKKKIKDQAYIEMMRKIQCLWLNADSSLCDLPSSGLYRPLRGL